MKRLREHKNKHLRSITRVAIILWINLAVMPAALAFDAIEAELERRGHSILTPEEFASDDPTPIRDNRAYRALGDYRKAS